MYNVFSIMYDARVYTTHPNFYNQEKIILKPSTNIKRDEINILNIIYENTFKRHLNKDNRCIKIILKSKLIGIANFKFTNII